MNNQLQPMRPHISSAKLVKGFTIVELMVAVTISLLIMTALITVYFNLSHSNREMAKTNSQIESGRFSIQLLQGDIVHAGYWGGYVPQHDDLSSMTAPASTLVVGGTVPTYAPDPCKARALWNSEYIANMIGIPIQVFTAVPATCAAAMPNQKAGTDVLVVRHAEVCVPGVGNCEADTAGKLYFQTSFCEKDFTGLLAQGSTATTLTLNSTASSTNNFYNGLTIRIVSGPGAGQSNVVTAYDGTSKIATLAGPWGAGLPSGSSMYVFGVGYVLDTTGFGYTLRNCTTTASKRKYISNIYYIRDYAVTAGDGIPTLMRSEFDLSAGVLAQQPAKALIEGIEGFKVELGVDNISDSGNNIITSATADRYYSTIKWTDNANLVSPTNRGDGNPDGAFVRTAHDCPEAAILALPAAACTAALTNVVAAKIYLLVRSRDSSPGYVDSKSYFLDSANATGVDPCTGASGAALTTCKSFKRHVYSTTIRLTNISGRRETPP
jgi:Tfp pilus assembly protein PilW